MSIRDFFNKSYKTLSSDISTLGEETESTGNLSNRLIEKYRFIPPVDFENPESFAKFGSARRYYEDSIQRIYNTYPYDGSLQERTQFSNESTYLDLYILDNLYPRSTGYAIISPNGWGTQVSSKSWGAGGDVIGKPSIVEYIQVIGGPHTASGGMTNKDLADTFSKSNIYDPALNRESNLKCDFDSGITIEFWMNKQQGSLTSGLSDVEMIAHLTNDNSGSVQIYLDTKTPGDDLKRRLAIAATTQTQVAIFESTLTNIEILDGNWHHYAISLKNSGSNLEVKTYYDGILRDSDNAAFFIGTAPLSEVTGALKMNVGASREFSYDLGGPDLDFPSDGWCKLSGSIDEFRYWKTKRTSEDIGKNWFTQYGGGTNRDAANTDLGVYLKFNEGITGNDHIDSVALDYSGRLSNGAWVGYTSEARSTGSAIDSHLSRQSEFRDPIIYPSHPEVKSLYEELSQSGSVYDLTNNSSIYTSIPSWITEEDTREGNSDLEILTQILSSYLDTLYLQIENLPHIKDKGYDSLDVKPYPFLDKILESHGFIAPEIFANADVISQILQRDGARKYELDLTDIKNAIYKNIYNNLEYIYKSKGTEKAFRNLVRCFGVDEELIKINVYGDNTSYDFRDSYKSTSERKKYADFNDPDRFDSTVYQQTASGNPNTLSYVPGVSSSYASYSSFTAEVEVIFPKKIEKRNSAYFPTTFLTSSIFGFHTADTGTVELTWKSPDYDLQVYAIRFEKESKDVYFSLQNTDGTINLTTDIYKDVYDNQKWNFAVRLSPEKSPHSDLPSGSSDTNYLLEFSGINSEIDYVSGEFKLSASINPITGSALLGEAKRMYLGAHRANFTGSTLAFSDAKISSLRYWASYLDDDVLSSHARDPSNVGVAAPYASTYLMQTSLQNIIVPQIETLALNWDFSSVTSSDGGLSGIPFVSDAGYLVQDVSSGSLDTIDRYKWLGDVVNHQLTGRGDFYLANDSKVTDARYVYSGKQALPEVIQASDTINSLGESDLAFTRDTRPARHFFAIEKSMYQAISEDMVNMFSTIVDFNTLVGEPVNRYRGEYKYLQKLRQLYFEKVENEPDLEKFISFYSWIDQSLGKMLQTLIPASAEFSEDIRNMVESHILERNKYRSKFPTLEFTARDPEAGLIGINKHLYDWKTGHSPVNGQENENCYWWKARAERNNPEITSGNATVDSNRQSYLNATISALNRSYTTPLRLNIAQQRTIHGGNNMDSKKSVDITRSKIKFGTSDGVEIANLSPLPDCTDESLEKVIINGAMKSNPAEEYLNSSAQRYFPYTFYFSSMGLELNNLHRDAYGPDMETPMQSPFTNAHVGGLQSRHVPLNQGADTKSTRPEAWDLQFLTIVHPASDNPRAPYYRDETAKRPLNIKNIKGPAGNYQYDYQAIMTSGRSVNNRAFVKSEGFSLIDPISDVSSSWVPDMATELGPEIDRLGTWGSNKYIIVERFSAPGGPDTMGDANGGPGLDKYAAEMSPNNDLNYRNSFVRDVLQSLHTSHVNKFGYFSDSQDIPGAEASEVNPLNYEGTGSIYKTNRNTRYSYRLSGTVAVKTPQYDNWYVQHPIPQSDFQYAWITASYVSSPYCGYLPPDGAPYSSSLGLIPAITFGPITSSYSWEIWPTWKQIRTGEELQARQIRENNQIVYNPPGKTFKNSSGITIIPKLSPNYKTFDEPCVVSKYRPVNQVLNDSKFILSATKISVKSSYGNNLSFFSNEELNMDLNVKPPERLAYDSIKDNYLETELIINPELEQGGITATKLVAPLLDSVKYEEIVFPASSNTYKKRNREREGYQNDFWRNSRSARSALGKTKFGG